jgi:bifunctional UDP-N-acetylglucosamine pyrophosphorylase / glucosamine-1-phosphate N-acetyltransferase
MRRVLVIPAAGRGSRLQSDVTKALVPVNGRPILGRLWAMYRDYVASAVVVASPANEAEIRSYCQTIDPRVHVAIQRHPTGMLDALIAAADDVRAANPERVWITWCDQVAIHPRTIARLASTETDAPDAALALPTVRRTSPYIHFDRDADGRIVAVRQQREGDAMPVEGESDAGLFALAAGVFHKLRQISAAGAAGRRSGERNFLPLIPLIAKTASVITFECTDPREAIGVNTPDELRQVEEYLRARRDT